jgi:DNA polymerase III subunit gamma/tau
MGQALYRKYRSKSLSEIVGQEHVTTTLDNAIKNGKISHAYLFTGPRGVGKTSIARILAHEINELPYTDESEHLDIIEIDAASNRRIDEIRDLREKVHISPTSAKYKVYIIDEVHMLTKEAFNALLKTLEEPPKHVIFILATTEAHKLPDTIVSRTQRFTFKPIEHATAVSHLVDIANQEKINIDDEALELIAEHGDGSFRDSISLLDQAAHSDEVITADDVRAMLGIAPSTAISQLINIISNQSPKDLIGMLEELRDQGYDPADIAKQLSDAIRKGIVEDDRSLDTEDSVHLLEKLLNVQASHNPSATLEIVLLDFMLSDHGSGHTTLESPDDTPQALENKREQEAKKNTDNQILPSDAVVGRPVVTGTWDDVLLAIKTKHNTIYSVVRMADVLIEGDKCIMIFEFPFHKRQIEDDKNKQIIAETIKEITGKSVKIETKVKTKVTKQSAKAAKADKSDNSSDTLEAITSIFGGGEMLEDGQ